MASKLIYQHPSDDLAKIYSPTLVDGTVDPNYPLSNLSNDNLGLPTKFTTPHIRLVWDLLSAQVLQLPVFMHWNVDSGATALFQAHTASSWGSPDLSTAITVNAPGQHGYVPFSWLDRSLLAAKRYVSLSITGAAANIVLGGIWLGATLRSVTHNPRWGVQQPIGMDTVVVDTNFGVRHSFSRNPTGGIRNGAIETTLDVGFPKLQAWAEACRWRARPTPVVFDPTKNRAQFVHWDQNELVPTFVSVNNVQVPVAFRDVSPGEAWL